MKNKIQSFTNFRNTLETASKCQLEGIKMIDMLVLIEKMLNFIKIKLDIFGFSKYNIIM